MAGQEMNMLPPNPADHGPPDVPEWEHYPECPCSTMVEDEIYTIQASECECGYIERGYAADMELEKHYWRTGESL